MAGHPVVLLAGQSNALGQIDRADLTTYAGYELEHDDTRTALLTQHNDGVAKTAYEIPPHKTSWFPTTGVGEVGPEIGIVRNIPNIITHGPNGNTFLIKSAAGGSDLANDWNIDDNVTFSQSWSKTKTFLSDVMTPWGDYEVKGVIWIQGETDAAVEASADAYAENLQELIDDSRVQWGAQVKWVILRLNDDHTGTYASTIQTQQDSLAADDVLIVNPNDAPNIPLGDDNNHYGDGSASGDDLVDVGIRLAVALDGLITACGG